MFRLNLVHGCYVYLYAYMVIQRNLIMIENQYRNGNNRQQLYRIIIMLVSLVHSGFNYEPPPKQNKTTKGICNKTTNSCSCTIYVKSKPIVKHHGKQTK